MTLSVTDSRAWSPEKPGLVYRLLEPDCIDAEGRRLHEVAMDLACQPSVHAALDAFGLELVGNVQKTLIFAETARTNPDLVHFSVKFGENRL